MNKDRFYKSIINLVNIYQTSPDYKVPIIKEQYISWHFVGWWAISLGIHFSLKHKNIEVHLPFGFIKIDFRKKSEIYCDVSIQI